MRAEISLILPSLRFPHERLGTKKVGSSNLFKARHSYSKFILIPAMTVIVREGIRDPDSKLGA